MTQTIRTIRIATQGPAGPQGPAGGVTSVAGRTGAVTLTKSDVGLSNAANADTSDAGNIASGTLADARLSSNVALKNAANTWSGANTFNNPLTVQGGALAIQTTTGTAFGVGAGAAKRTDVVGSDDVFIGYGAGQLVPSGQTHSTIIGSLAAPAMTAGAGATAIGQKSLITATTIQSSVAVGGKTGSSLTSVLSDVFVGYAAAQFAAETNLGRRVFVGYEAGEYDSGDYNVMIGYQSGPQNSGVNANPATGARNIGLGALTLNNLKNGVQNVAIGHQALNAVVTGNGNIAIGYQAGYGTTGSSNVFIGNNAGTANVAGSNNIFLGNGAGWTVPASQSNTFVAGSDSSGGNDRIDHVYFGKGYATSAPSNYTIHGTHGSGSNIAGGSVTIAAGQSTGTGVSGDVVIQTGGTGAGATSLNPLVTALTIKGATQQVVVGGASPLVAFGGTTASFPALKQSGAAVQARLADDSGFAPIQGKLTAHANAVAETIVPDKTITLYDASGNAYKVPCVAV